jgi:hypothetical protein
MAATVLTEVNFRVYIGPHHLHYDWSAHSLAASFSANLYTPTTTTGQVSGSTSLVIASSTGFGTVGGVWVGANGTGEGWEYERFTGRSGTTLTVVRESTTDREHNGVHTNGASVYQFYPVTTTDGTLNIVEDADETLSTVTWRATISGVRAPRHVLRNGHIVVVTTSVNGGAYTIALVGFVDNPTISDNYRSAAEWTLNIVSSAGLVAEVQAHGVRVGDLDLADAGSASSVQELVLAYDERASGDYTQASPDFSASSAIDNEFNTLWIAERFVGTDIWSNAANSDPENGYDLAFAQIYCNPPTSAGSGAKWIELRVRSNTNVQGYALNIANGNTGPNGCEIWQFGGPGEVEDGGSIFFVEDEEVFNRLNPLAQSVAIYEDDAGYFDHIFAAGGELWLRIGEINSWTGRVRWGTGNSYVQHPDAPARTWTGSTVTAPTTGQTMRYIWTNSSGTASAYWNTSMVKHAGYNIDNDDPVWIMATLPGLGLTLAQDITASVPGNSGQLYINGPDDKYSTDGLPSSGTLFIGDEKIAYSSKTDQYVTLASSGARGAGGTTAAIHNAGDEVYLMDGSTPTDAYLISSVGWTRGGSIYPKSFKVYTSNLIDNVRNSDQDNYLDDWTLRDTVTLNAANNYSYALSNVRVKHILIEILSMTTDPARPRLNEINAIVNASLHNPELWLAADTTAGALIQQILETAGIWPGAISHSGTPAIDESVTADDNAWTVVADIAEYSGCRVTIGRDSKFTIAVDAFWTGTPSIATTWNRTSAVSVAPAFRKVSPVSQVILPWRKPDGSDSGKIYYPSQPERGTRLELPETLYSSSAAASTAAQRLYYMRLYPVEATVVGAGETNEKRPGEAHQLYWQLIDDPQPMDRNCVVMSADHTLAKGNWSSTFKLVQYGHESNF